MIFELIADVCNHLTKLWYDLNLEKKYDFQENTNNIYVDKVLMALTY